MKPTIVQSEGQLSHYIQMTNKYGDPVYIPVVDVRDGVAERALGGQIIKAQNRSRYINYNQYHFSQKQDKKQFDI